MTTNDKLFKELTSTKVKEKYNKMKTRADKKGKKIKWGRRRKKIDVQEIMRLRDQLKGYRTIADIMKQCSYQTIRRRVIEYEKNKVG